MGSLPAGITRTGKFTLTDNGILEARQDKNNEKIGEIVVGIDGVYFDGFEPIFTQRNDPPKLRLASRFDSGIGGGGAISFNRLRSDDRMEEMVMINCGSLDNPTDDRGMFRVLIRQSQDPEDWGVAFVATTQYLNKLWTGAGNFLGWLWKYGNSGDGPPIYMQAGRVTRFYTDGGKFCVNMQDDQGNIRSVKYLIVPTTQHPNIVTTDESTWVSVGESIL